MIKNTHFIKRFILNKLICISQALLLPVSSGGVAKKFAVTFLFSSIIFCKLFGTLIAAEKSCINVVIDQELYHQTGKLDGGYHSDTGSTSESSGINYFKNKEFEFAIRLSKNTFKKFEPILILAEYINKSNTVDSIYEDFSSINPNVKFYLTDNKGTSYNVQFGPQSVYFTHEKPTCILNPGDSFKFIYDLNRMVGMQSLYKYSEEYLYQKANYEPGKFTLYIQTIRNGKILISNEVEFNIIDINDEDKNVLELSKLKKYDEIIQKFPSNSYTEYIFIEKIKYLRYERYSRTSEQKQDTEQLNDSIINCIYEFLIKYPHSYFGYEYISWVFIDELRNKFENIDELIKYVNLNYQNTTFKEYINTTTIKSFLRETYNNK